MTAFDRHRDVLIRLLLAGVASVAVVACTGPANSPLASDPSPAVASASPSPATSSAGEPVPSSMPPAGVESPSTTEIAPGVMAHCAAIEPAACAKAIALARAGNEGDLVGTSLVVVDDTCPPATECDPHLPFDAIVVFVTAGGDTTGWYGYHVTGTEAIVPEKSERWQDDIPAHIVDRIRAALATL